MTRVLYVILSVIAASFIVSCSGNYNANPSSNTNYSVNPANPPKFDWLSSGKDPMSCTINGVSWVATGASFAFSPSTGNVILGAKGSQDVEIIIPEASYNGNTYSMGYLNYTTSGAVYDSFGTPNPIYNYFSYKGVAGAIYIIENDSAIIKGLFYFEGVNNQGNVINVTDGYFNIHKF